MFTDCDAFTDGQHRFAYDGLRGEPHRYQCACGAARRNADDAPELLTVNEDTDFAALPFATGYNVEDYPPYLQRVAEQEPVPIEQVARTIPPHTHVWVEDGRYTDTGDFRERCVGCPAIRSLTPSELEQDGAA